DPNLSGSFEGSGEGRNGTITTRVTISEGKISDIVVIESQESPEYFEPIFNQIVATMIAHNNINIEAISGATLSSEGVVNSVKEALKQSGSSFVGKKTKIGTPVNN
ncbi:MAG: FMN-binding protein, partial [Brevinema sp.]